VLLLKTPYTQQQPTGLAGNCVLISAFGLGCWLVVAVSASRQKTHPAMPTFTIKRVNSLYVGVGVFNSSHV